MHSFVFIRAAPRASTLSGQIGFVLCSKPDEEGKTVDFTKPHRPPPMAPGEFKCALLQNLESTMSYPAVCLLRLL